MAEAPHGRNWNDPLNWDPFGVPTSSTTTALTFGATSIPGMSNDIPGTFLLNSMTFTDVAPAYTLTGNTLGFRHEGFTGTPPEIWMNSANGVTISNNLILNGEFYGDRDGGRGLSP